MRLTLVCIIFTLCSCLDASETFTMATWNIRMFSEKKRSGHDLVQIASILSRYDLIAVQEIRDSQVMLKLIKHLPGYSYILSAPVGRRNKEQYAFLYKKDGFKVLGSHIYPDKSDHFIREPYIAHFRTGNFDFTLINIHILYGERISDRREEIAHLKTLVRNVESYTGPEEDILVIGDFNLHAEDKAWDLTGYRAVVPPSVKTTISDRSSYDNLWYKPESTREFIKLQEVYAFDELLYNNNDRLIEFSISDHRPVSFLFSRQSEDDDEEGQWAAMMPFE